MPSVQDLLKSPGRVNLNVQEAGIVIPPLQRYGQYVDLTGAVTLADVLPEKPNTVYVIHAIFIAVANDGTSTATAVACNWTDFWTGITANISCRVNAASVNSNNLNITGLNIPCMSGTAVTFTSDGTSLNRGVRVLYSEVTV